VQGQENRQVSYQRHPILWPRWGSAVAAAYYPRLTPWATFLRRLAAKWNLMTTEVRGPRSDG